jgi:serine kinase of HPr protein (carbohydrate metabolism regulator)
MSGAAENLHASAVQLAGKGVVIFGASGSGKSSLALELLRHVLRDGKEAWLISDDRVAFDRRGDDLIAAPPAPLAGLIEVRGSGIHPIKHIPFARLHLAVELVEESQALRMPPQAPKLVARGVALPCLILPSGQTQACMRAILSHLGLFHPVLPLGKSD